jgi:cysteine desulfurase
MPDSPIYLDHSATTPVDPNVLSAMLPYFSTSFGNPAALYSVGMEARSGVETARVAVAAALNASPDEIVFTSGGTESDNTALWGVAMANLDRPRHLITTSVEHHAVLEPIETLSRNGCEVDVVQVGADGRIDPAEVRSRIRKETLIISVMHANNEIGTIQPIKEIGQMCREAGVLFHSDAVQSFGKIPIDVNALNIDLLSVSAHKLYGPKGIGALYIRRGTRLARFQEGGEQERGRRGGTLNVPGIVGLGRAIQLATAEMDSEWCRLTELRDRFFDQLCARIEGVHITGSRSYRMANNIHFCVDGVDGEPMLLSLDMAGICASAGSACTTGSEEPSHVLTAVGLPRSLARGALRLTMGRSTTWDSLEIALEALVSAITGLRRLSTAR